ncbi:MAG: phospholipid carrier-dependent glycosyltransferase, partial [Planctomycetota bacterium]
PILRGLGVGQEDRLSVGVWSTGLGLIAAGMLLLGLGLLGGLYVPVIGVATVAACFWGLGEIIRGRLHSARQKEQWPGGAPPNPADEPQDAPCTPPARWLSRGILLAAAAASLGSLFGALAPPTAGDALCYHLELPKTFLAEHRILYLPYHDNSTFPLLVEMWYLWGLALDGGVCAQLVHWGLGILLALAAAVLATPILGRRWAWIVAAVVVLTPGVNNQMTAPLNDVALATLTTLALAAWWRGAIGQHGRRWFVVAGLAAGGALGTKYLALVFAAAMGLTWIWAVARRAGGRRLLLEGAAVAAVVAASIGGPWYARAAWHRGNPVFPFLGEVFGSVDSAAGLRETLPQSKSPLGRGPLGLAAAAWQVTMHPERFGGRGHQLGVLLLAALPGVLLCRRLRGLGTLLGVGLGYCVLWYLLRQNVRFLFPAVAPLSVAAVWVWIEMRRFPRFARLASAATFVGVLLAMTAVALARSRDQMAVAVGLEDRQHYLLRQEPTYRAAEIFNVLASPGDHLLSQDYRAFYFNGRVTRESIYRRCTDYDRQITDPAELSGRLRGAGFTHLLLAETLTGDGIRYDPTLSRLADAQLAAGAHEELVTLDEYRFPDSDGAVRRYRLVKLDGAPGSE